MGYTDGTTTASYTYRPNGLRNTKTVGTNTERYIWVGDQVSLICDGNNLVKDKYAYGNRRISRETTEVAGETLGTRSNYMYNGHGDVMGLTDSTGTVTKTYDYDAFGVEVNASATDTNPFRYAGEMWDDTTDTYYLRARNYDPTIGRFTTEDTHWNVGNMIYGDREYGEGERKVADIRAINQSLNRYAYCMNNPIMYVDPSGEGVILTSIIIGGIIGIVAGAITGAVISHKQYEKVKWQYVAIGAGVGTVAGVGAGAGIGAVVQAIGVTASGTIGVGLYKTLEQGVNFTKTTLGRMTDSGRFVPVQTLIEAIRHGVQSPDPQGTNATMYTIEMIKNGKTYMLEVLYDKVTNTILHFKYWR